MFKLGRPVKQLPSAKAYTIMDNSGVFLNRTDSERFPVIMEEFQVCYHVLASDSLEKGVFRYNSTIKHHWAFHIGRHARWLNPKVCHCYAWENFVGLLQQAAEACTAGTAVHLTPNKLMQNYLHVLSLHLARE